MIDDVRGGYPVGGHHPEPNGGLLPEDSESFTQPALPVDLAAVQADDALLDAQSRGRDSLARRPDAPTNLCPDPSSPEGRDRFAQALLAWRREVESEPMPRLMDTDTALALIRRRSERRGLRRLARWLRTALRGAR